MDRSKLEAFSTELALFGNLLVPALDKLRTISVNAPEWALNELGLIEKTLAEIRTEQLCTLSSNIEKQIDATYRGGAFSGQSSASAKPEPTVSEPTAANDADGEAPENKALNAILRVSDKIANKVTQKVEAGIAVASSAVVTVAEKIEREIDKL